jgi:hypothetical protein
MPNLEIIIGKILKWSSLPILQCSFGIDGMSLRKSFIPPVGVIVLTF